MPGAEDRPEYMLVGEAAEYARMHPQTLRRWIKKGLVPATRPSGLGRGRWYLKRSDLDKFLRGELS